MIIESLIYLLIQLLLVGLAIYLVIWVLGIFEVQLPAKVIQILWVIFALIAVLIIIRSLPGLGVRRLW